MRYFITENQYDVTVAICSIQGYVIVIADGYGPPENDETDYS